MEKKKQRKMEGKAYVLDTNVLIHNPDSIFSFEENTVIILITVIKELDGLKKGHGETAYSARKAIKNMNALRKKGSICKGVGLESGGILKVVTIPRLENSSADPDTKIIETAKEIKLQNSGLKVVLVSKDENVQIRAEAAGLIAEDYKHDKTSLFKKYGRILGEEEYQNGILSVRYRKERSGIVRIVGESSEEKIKEGKELEGIKPKNDEQKCAIDALINPNIHIVALSGPAGTGKTLLALAAAIHQTTKKSPLFEQVVVARPIVPMGNDLGFLPGDVSEKLAPWMQPIFDNLEVIVGTPKERKEDSRNGIYKSFQYLIDSGVLQVEPLTYIRGRSLPKRYFIIDEAQNLRPIDVKTIITRCGEGTKIVFTGDINQIDTPYLDAQSNGLSYLISKFIQEENFCFLNLTHSVRSQLAEQGARLL